MATNWTTEIRSRLAGSRSLARHGRASRRLAGARQILSGLLVDRKHGIEDDASAQRAVAEHDAALREMGLPGPLAHNPLNR